MNNTISNLYNEILEEIRKGQMLSKILPSVLILAKKLKNSELEMWTQLEMNSYFTSNPALTKEVIVPEYRIVAGQYFDIYGRPLLISDPQMQFINEYRLRQSVSELEKMEGSNKLLSVQDQSFIKIIKDKLNIDVNSFSFTSSSINGILDGIKTSLINKLLSIDVLVEDTGKSNEPVKVTFNMENLHPLIQPVASELYSNGHFRQAILDTYILLVNTVKTKSGRHDLDGTALMQTVFSPKKPVIKISEDLDEQQGFMWMFSGAVMGIRNPKAHRLIQQKDPQRTIEWLSFASVLLRVLDDAQVINE